jgi:hypothetical protein
VYFILAESLWAGIFSGNKKIITNKKLVIKNNTAEFFLNAENIN